MLLRATGIVSTFTADTACGKRGGFLNITGHGGPGSSVGTATRYRLDSPGIEPQCVRDFLESSTPALVPTQPPIQWTPVLFPGVKAAGT
jgi:hypothetical protein